MLILPPLRIFLAVCGKYFKVPFTRCDHRLLVMPLPALHFLDTLNSWTHTWSPCLPTLNSGCTVWRGPQGFGPLSKSLPTPLQFFSPFPSSSFLLSLLSTTFFIFLEGHLCLGKSLSISTTQFSFHWRIAVNINTKNTVCLRLYWMNGAYNLREEFCI